MITMTQLSKRMQKYSVAVEAAVNKIVQKTALLVDQVVVSSTPVDTGKARSNWLPSLGGPRNGTIPPYVPYPSYADPVKFGESGNAQGAIDAARLVVGARSKSSEDIYIRNSVHYISDLNDGNSRQAPAGFVQMAVQAASASIQTSAGRILKEHL